MEEFLQVQAEWRQALKDAWTAWEVSVAADHDYPKANIEYQRRRIELERTYNSRIVELILG